RARGSAVPGSGKSVGVPLPSFFGDGFLEVDPADVENVEKGQAEGTDSVPVPKVDVARSGPLTPQVLKQGFLHKAGRHGQIIWRGRWFVLESDVLCYYSSEKDVSEGKKPKPKGVISLHGSFVQKGKDPTRFRLLTPKRTYAFRADSVQEAQVLFATHSPIIWSRPVVIQRSILSCSPLIPPLSTAERLLMDELQPRALSLSLFPPSPSAWLFPPLHAF
ncbi:MAG: hypothetical protein SGPRY_009482, partial [Prymnesium sp.]